jgi:hypothetical protein
MCRMGAFGDAEGISRLLDEGVDPSTLDECDGVSLWSVFPSLMVSVFQDLRTALHWAAIRCHMPVVRLLVDRAPHLLDAKNYVSGTVSSSLLVD